MAGEVQSLLNGETKIRVSSTLDKSVGKKNLTDGSPETCWTSQQGTPQFIQISFPSPVVPRRIDLTFQGGFAGTRCLLECLLCGQADRDKTWRALTRIYPEDVNRQQSFEIVPNDADMVGRGIEAIKLVFEESSDFFGRITVYDLQLYGVPAE